MPHIQLSTEVKAVEKEGDTWKTTCSNSTTYTSKYLVIATGVVQKPNRELEQSLLGDFTGKIYHVSEIKAPIEEHKGQRLLVLGGGESASDIVTEWRDLVEVTYWSIPRGQHFFRKYAKVLPWVKPQAYGQSFIKDDENTVSPFNRGKPGLLGSASGRVMGHSWPIKVMEYQNGKMMQRISISTSTRGAKSARSCRL